jgi:hypothetical protein
VVSWSIVVAAVGRNLASLRALTVRVFAFDDSSLPEQIVRFATGHLPLTGWLAFLGRARSSVFTTSACRRP